MAADAAIHIKEWNMPIYEYKCGDCGTVSEFIVLKQDEEITCPLCGGAKLTKLMSAHNTASSSGSSMPDFGGCCGSPGSCGTPGGCCSG